jgi:ribonuclease BN (tRNA processing enzyme)
MAQARHHDLWAPGAWLYGTPSAEILGPLLRPPISPNDLSGWPVQELREGLQSLSGFDLRASAQPHHWAPSAGLRVDDELAYVTDTPYESSSVELAGRVRHLLHEAWSASAAPEAAERDATAADAGRVARHAEVESLTLIHLNPGIDDHGPLADDARSLFAAVTVGEDGMELSSR